MRLSTIEWTLVFFASSGCAAATPPGAAESAPPAAVASSGPPPMVGVAESQALPPPPVMSSEPAPVAPVDPLLSPQVVWETRDMGVAVPAEWQTCVGTDDCQVVVSTCCDECNGGKAVSVAKAHVADVRAKYTRPGCGMCTKRGCLNRAACDEGRCVIQWPKAG